MSKQLQEREQALRTDEQRLKTWKINELGSKREIQECLERSQEISAAGGKSKSKSKSKVKVGSGRQIAENQAVLAQSNIWDQRNKARRAEQELRDRHLAQQQSEWQQQKLKKLS